MGGGGTSIGHSTNLLRLPTCSPGRVPYGARCPESLRSEVLIRRLPPSQAIPVRQSFVLPHRLTAFLLLDPFLLLLNPGLATPIAAVCPGEPQSNIAKMRTRRRKRSRRRRRRGEEEEGREGSRGKSHGSSGGSRQSGRGLKASTGKAELEDNPWGLGLAVAPLRTAGLPKDTPLTWQGLGRRAHRAKSLPEPHPVPCPGSGQGLKPGATALMRRCCCRDSALQRCLHLFYFSIIKTQAATQPDSLAVGAGKLGSAEKGWERAG